MRFLAVFLGLLLACATASAQQQPGDTSPAETTTVFPHSRTGRLWISGQLNFVFQAHSDFRALYSGENSLKSNYEKATSRVLTLYTGLQVARRTDLLLDVESSGGRGISDALGLAGFTNLDVVRNPDLGSKPYVARVMLHQTIRLGGVEEKAERGPLSLATSVPSRRLEFRIGKFSTADFFDVNSIGSDSHLQFLNWLTDLLRIFARWGWNEGQHESFAYTEVDHTFSLGGDCRGTSWRRRKDKLGAAFVSNGISKDHQTYLRSVCKGFLLGDGSLNYQRENIVECNNAH